MTTALRDTTGMKTKTCGKCGETKPLDAFSPDKKGKQGRRSQCKACGIAYRAKRFKTDEAFRERVLAYNRGEELEPVVRPTADERLDAFLIPEPNTGCLLFTGGTSNGYGVFWLDNKQVRAHRVAYERVFGPIQPGLEVHHRCGNTLCCEPSHLQAVTPEEHAAIHAKEVE